MAITHYVVCFRNIWKSGRIFNYINILKPVYFNVFLHSNFLQCTALAYTSISNSSKKNYINIFFFIKKNFSKRFFCKN